MQLYLVVICSCTTVTHKVTTSHNRHFVIYSSSKQIVKWPLENWVE